MKPKKVMPTGGGKMVPKPNPRLEMEGAEIAASIASPCTVTVMGFDRKDVLFRTDKANIIQVRNGAGEISALLVRIRGEIWGFSKRGDDDWNEVLALFGNDDKE